VAGYFSQSQALIADGIHSLSDLSYRRIWCICCLQPLSPRSDEKSTLYGQSFVLKRLPTVFLGMVLTIVALGIAYELLSRHQKSQAQSHLYGLARLFHHCHLKKPFSHYTKKAEIRLAVSLASSAKRFARSAATRLSLSPFSIA